MKQYISQSYQTSLLATSASKLVSRYHLMLLGVVMFFLPTSVGIAGEPAISKVFLLAGQSNMESQGSLKDLPKALRRPPSNVFYWKKGSWKRYEFHDAWQMPGKEFGPELSLAYQLASAYPNETLGVLKVAKGGTAIKQWGPESALMQTLLREMRAATSTDHHEVAGMFWMQGERDARFGDSKYAERFRQLIEQIRRETGQSQLPFVFGQISCIVPKRKFNEEIRAAQTQTASKIEHVSMVVTDDLERKKESIVVDGQPTTLLAHYSSQGQIELGIRFAEAYLEIIRPPTP